MLPGSADPSNPEYFGTPTQGHYYIMKEGDDLSTIAQKAYGDDCDLDAMVDKIFQANRNVISDENVIQPGWKIYLPYTESV